MGCEARRLLPPLWPKDCVGVPMSASSRDMCDLFRAEMALEHAWRALDRAERALPIKSKDGLLAEWSIAMALNINALSQMVFRDQGYCHDLLKNEHGGDDGGDSR